MKTIRKSVRCDTASAAERAEQKLQVDGYREVEDPDKDLEPGEYVKILRPDFDTTAEDNRVAAIVRCPL